MRTVTMTAEQTALYDAGDSPAWRAEKRHLMGVMDAIGEQYWRDGVHVECVTADGVVLWAHDYERARKAKSWDRHDRHGDRDERG